MKGLFAPPDWLTFHCKSRNYHNQHVEKLQMARLPTRPDDDKDTNVLTRPKPKAKKPSLYKVLLLNDDYTPMEFVVHVLETVFGKSMEDAYRIMLHVHQKGVGVCGVYTFEIAETKVTQVMDMAKEHGHPLQCTMEKE
jgi:ATP-dependent Clp protease adaptor protein ClpS